MHCWLSFYSFMFKFLCRTALCFVLVLIGFHGNDCRLSWNLQLFAIDLSGFGRYYCGVECGVCDCSCFFLGLWENVGKWEMKGNIIKSIWLLVYANSCLQGLLSWCCCILVLKCFLSVLFCDLVFSFIRDSLVWD